MMDIESGTMECEETAGKLNNAIEALIQGDSVGEVRGRYEAEPGFESPESKENFRELLIAYEGVIDESRAVGNIANEHGLSCEISTKPGLSFEFGWDCSLPGIWITFSKGKNGNSNRPESTLLALPPTGMNTNAYGPYFFGGEPSAADLLRVNEKAMLFVSQESTPPGEFLVAVGTKEEPDEEASYLLPVCLVKRRGALLDVELNDPVCVDAPASHSRDEVVEIVFDNLPYIHLIGICTSGYPVKEIIPRK